MKPNLFIGARTWTAQQVAEVVNLSHRIRGIILGDPFCSLRMFANGNWDIPECAVSAREVGLRVALQTPVYLTERNFDDTLNLIASLESRGLLSLLLAQDIGLLSELETSGSAVPICWSFWGKNRADALNRDALDFLAQLNVRYMELEKPWRVGPLQEHGLRAVFRLYAPQLATYGRVCYTRYITGLPCNGGLCSNELPRIVSLDGRLDLRVNGYTLEYATASPKALPKDPPDYMTVYVDELTRLPEVLENVFG